MPALAPYSRAKQRAIHERSCDAFLYNLRTKATSPAYLDTLVRPYIDTNLDMHTMAEVFVDDDWLEGDFFTVTYTQRPGFVSTRRRVKFIETREDGVPIKRLVIQGTIDRAS